MKTKTTAAMAKKAATKKASKPAAKAGDKKLSQIAAAGSAGRG